MLSRLQILKLSLVKGVGPVTLRMIHETAVGQGVDAAIEQLSEEQQEFYRNNEQVALELQTSLEQRGISILTWLDALYPARLLHIAKKRAPPLLFSVGSVENLNMELVGVAGPRAAVESSIERATQLGSALSRARVGIVNGGAKGVDAAASNSALNAGGVVVHILAEGILTRALAGHREMIEAGLLTVVSEFHPFARWSAGQAMQRNTTICGLSNAMIVIDPNETGGTIAAAKTAMELNIPTYVAKTKESAIITELLDRGAQMLGEL